MSGSVALEEDFIQMPFVTGPNATSPQTGGILFAKLVAPGSDRLLAQQYSASGHHFLHITEAQAEPEIEPNAMRNDLSRKPMATVRTVKHSSSMPSPRRSKQCDNTPEALRKEPSKSLANKVAKLYEESIHLCDLPVKRRIILNSISATCN